MVKSESFEAKRSRGVALRPWLWERIDLAALDRGESANRVIEVALEAAFSQVCDSSNGVESNTTPEGVAR